MTILIFYVIILSFLTILLVRDFYKKDVWMTIISLIAVVFLLGSINLVIYRDSFEGKCIKMGGEMGISFIRYNNRVMYIPECLFIKK